MSILISAPEPDETTEDGTCDKEREVGVIAPEVGVLSCMSFEVSPPVPS